MNRWQKLDNRLRQVLRAEDGGIMLLGVFLLIAILGFGGLAVDFSRAAELRRKLQVAADTAAREYLMGQDLETLTALCRASVANCTVTVDSGPPTVVVTATADYTPLFKSVYTYLGVASAMSARARSSATSNCALPDPATETQWVSSTEACPAGQTGSITTLTEQSRAASCPVGATSAVWSDWSATGETQVTNTCTAPPTPQCHDDNRQPRYRWSASRQEACPAGMSYGSTYYRVRQVSWPSCDDNNDEGWTAWEDVVPEQRSSEVNNTCSSSCIVGSQTQWQEDRQKGAVFCPSTHQTEDLVGLNLYGNTFWCTGGIQHSTGWQSRNTWKYMEADCPTGGKAYKTTGTHTWTVPDRVKRVSVLAVGGGASGSVAGPTSGTYAFGPGEASVVQTPGNVTGRGGGYDAVLSNGYYKSPGTTGGCGSSKEGGGCGGTGGNTPIVWNGDQTWTSGGASFVYAGGGGGAAGYYSDSSAGQGSALGWTTSPQAGHKGGGGGGWYHNVLGGGGGGVGIYSYVVDGVWGVVGAAGGGGGSAGESAGVGTDTLSVTAGGTITAPSGGAYGGGGGGLMAPSSTSWDRGYAGGGGELSFRNDETVKPNGTVTVVVGKGGVAPTVTRQAGGVTFNAQPGAGGNGAARIIWGIACWNQARAFPDQHASDDVYDRCAWSSD